MPNWCENDLVVKGKKVHELVEFVKSPESNFDFNKILQMPEVFENISTGYTTINGKQYTHWRTQSDTNVGVEQEELDGWMSKYGCTNWHTWCVDNWGTKWGAKDVFLIQLIHNSVMFSFNTAWSPPIPVITELARVFPTLKFSLKYYESGFAFKGYAKYREGSCVEKGQGSYAGRRGG